MSLFDNFACFSGSLHSGQEVCLSATFSKRVFATAFGVMLAVAWSIGTLFNVACVFVVHNLSFAASNRLADADALLHSIEQDGTA
tara:strand:+ start:1155 stop:1409 length:255 start_codon:yes stop_codon:yes gene_type:complete